MVPFADPNAFVNSNNSNLLEDTGNATQVPPGYSVAKQQPMAAGFPVYLIHDPATGVQQLMYHVPTYANLSYNMIEPNPDYQDGTICSPGDNSSESCEITYKTGLTHSDITNKNPSSAAASLENESQTDACWDQNKTLDEEMQSLSDRWLLTPTTPSMASADIKEEPISPGSETREANDTPSGQSIFKPYYIERHSTHHEENADPETSDPLVRFIDSIIEQPESPQNKYHSNHEHEATFKTDNCAIPERYSVTSNNEGYVESLEDCAILPSPMCTSEESAAQSECQILHYNSSPEEKSAFRGEQNEESEIQHCQLVLEGSFTPQQTPRCPDSVDKATYSYCQGDLNIDNLSGDQPQTDSFEEENFSPSESMQGNVELMECLRNLRDSHQEHAMTQLDS